MICEIVTDPILLSRISRPAQAQDFNIARDLRDTLMAHADHCVGMAANMIGRPVRVIAILLEGEPVVMINPQLLKTSGKNTRLRKAAYR